MNEFDRQCEEHILWMESLLNEESKSEQRMKTDYSKEISDLINQISTKNQDHNPLNRLQNVEPQYRISDVDESDEENESSFVVDDSFQINGQIIPEWAKASNLIIELQEQQSIDPDSIFPYFDPNVDLSQMFNKKKKLYKIRGDSGWWAVDGVTQTEILSYKKAIGFE